MKYDELDIRFSTYQEIKEAIEEQYKSKMWTDHNGNPITLKSWKQTNKELRDELKLLKVKCKGVFYNPNDGKAYIKQTFRTVRIDGLPQRLSSSEDFLTATGEDYYTDYEYFSVPTYEEQGKIIIRR